MENDDRTVGQLFTRREALRLFGLAGAAFLAACTSAPDEQGTAPGEQPGGQAAQPATAPARATASVSTGNVPGCVVRPEMTEGPYFVDEALNRSDIRADPADNSLQEGVPLALTFAVYSLADNACTPLPGAQVDVWHCNALGVYSGVVDFGGSFDARGKQFLRGYQLTDASGLAKFATIYPGWYPGRAVHIHFKIRASSAAGQAYDFTSQLFFDDALSDQVFMQAPYASQGQRDVLNAQDRIYQNGGDQLTLALSQAGAGYEGVFNLALDLNVA